MAERQRRADLSPHAWYGHRRVDVTNRVTNAPALIALAALQVVRYRSESRTIDQPTKTGSEPTDHESRTWSLLGSFHNPFNRRNIKAAPPAAGSSNGPCR